MHGKDRGIRLGRIYAMISSSEFIFWIGLFIAPQPTFAVPVFSNMTISTHGLSIPILHLILSLPLIIVGAWFGTEGVRETGMELAETHCSPKKILNTGIYSKMRHPQYSGWIIAHIGISMLLSTWYSMLFTPCMILLVYLVSKKEEKELEKEFGGEYAGYKKNVPMFIPAWRRSRVRND